MDFRTPDLLDVWLESPEEVSAGAFLELGLPYPAPEVPGPKLREQGPGGWEPSGGRDCVSGLQESEPEDFLQLFIDPNEVYCSEASRGSDSAIPEDPGLADSSPALCEVVYEAGGLERPQGEAGPAVGLISLQLGPRSPPRTVPAACTVGELPLAAHAHTPPSVGAANPVPPATLIRDMSSSESTKGQERHKPLELPCQTLLLTEEEKRLLGQEGVSLPSSLPLTKAEERALQKVRRKIRNKQSAQDSRRRKKEYVDGLESRAAACSAQNQELQKKVRELERHNIALEAQLHQLQMLAAQTSNKAAQTGTCVLILLFSLALIILPSVSPLQGLREAGTDDHQPQGVISRNILTHKDMTESLGATAVEPGLEGPPRAKGVNGSTRNLLEKSGGKTGPRGHVRAVLRADEM
ncbi:cyclic AMP-responsive element-binding protein 3-like protein 4 isoform X1 [Mustela erminea]|uniref:cyclic AMP-responsive element-binding protein 3-like protein 4 isoform X1 n=1 Tax=Mustela erminea TaxID=36723 RepID=UPI001386BA08|nr:cyclic AMP-responsive element-binding protein 3-like protein 4 isoform X1 [Mustela erminea]XP_032173537.1 cyclic AMP-responsive element-binding protein 3-like protein 4 isoform X1 [Mustela erminea]XP_032173538.1 cyclic AMP-responsive element-binding protein 3-like protein 4 isoform X1 [Mustela erminea]XP_032173539.1 cyclic AMP-responsive element-binding protein 3-like protein 4 isoform X1 [Mustela erminea]XP_032173540.1 cyclic AMP-responsive element-binding protein 3-like protein 4 isoform X